LLINRHYLIVLIVFPVFNLAAESFKINTNSLLSENGQNTSNKVGTYIHHLCIKTQVKKCFLKKCN